LNQPENNHYSYCIYSASALYWNLELPDAAMALSYLIL